MSIPRSLQGRLHPRDPLNQPLPRVPAETVIQQGNTAFDQPRRTQQDRDLFQEALDSLGRDLRRRAGQP
jgi:hypothetical protein